MQIDIEVLKENVKSEFLKSAGLCRDVLKAHVEHYANLTDHSLGDLAKTGHPYSAKNPHPPHSEPFVHTHSGNLLKGVQTKIEEKGDTVTLSVFIDKADVPYIDYIVEGTSKMIPRDFASAAFDSCEGKLRKIIENGVHAAASSRGGKTGRQAAR